MLQRIQSVYMLGSVVSVLMMLLLPLGTISSSEATFGISALGVTSVTDEVPLDEMRYSMLFLLLLMLILPLVCIFLYNKRRVQQRLLIYTAIIDILFFAYFFLYEEKACLGLAVKALQECGYDSIPTIGYRFILFAMPVLSIFCCVMAFRGVTFDIALLASADRLRPSRSK